MMVDLVKSFLNGTRLLETGMLVSLFVNATLAKFGNSLPRTMSLGEVPKGRRSQCQNTVGPVLKRFICFLRLVSGNSLAPKRPFNFRIICLKE
ncbi:hypothetical protein DPMN_044253 [Dreissena polymorpha]|uniref:Uncharacterized protein n=1 Tax=Dreissena polymorpha TaxID=45954 RepID=A0A9D4D443_DREPO|nr:hypothetical protein DPMN_044253 [Dreissena polymorpha]